MARLNLDTIKKLDKDRNTVHTPVTATLQYLTRWTENITCRLILTGRTIVQYPRRSVSLFSLIRKVQNSFVDLLSKEFDL